MWASSCSTSGLILLAVGWLTAVWEKGRVARRKNAQESMAGIFEELDCKRGKTKGVCWLLSRRPGREFFEDGSKVLV